MFTGKNRFLTIVGLLAVACQMGTLQGAYERCLDTPERFPGGGFGDGSGMNLPRPSGLRIETNLAPMSLYNAQPELLKLYADFLAVLQGGNKDAIMEFLSEKANTLASMLNEVMNHHTFLANLIADKGEHATMANLINMYIQAQSPVKVNLEEATKSLQKADTRIAIPTRGY